MTRDDESFLKCVAEIERRADVRASLVAIASVLIGFALGLTSGWLIWGP